MFSEYSCCVIKSIGTFEVKFIKTTLKNVKIVEINLKNTS